MSTLNNIIKVTKEQYDKLRDGEKVNGHAYDESALYLVEDDTDQKITQLTKEIDELEDYCNGIADIALANEEDIKELEEDLSSITDEVICDHVLEITGVTGHEYNLAINDQQMLLNKIQGQTFTVNQYVNKDNFPSEYSANGITYTFNKTTGTITANGTATANTAQNFAIKIEFCLGHKYIMLGIPSAANNKVGCIIFANLYDANIKYVDAGRCYYGNEIFDFSDTTKHTSGKYIYCQIYTYANQVANNLVFTPQLIDLTQWFGAGNEPTTVEEFYSRYKGGYISYNPGTFAHSKCDLVSTGKNLWNERWFNGYYDVNGNKITGANYISTEDFIQVIPNTQYSSNHFRYWCMYDINKQFISRISGSTVTTSSNCYYAKCTSLDTYGTNYNNNIIVNFGASALEYEPYKEEVVLVNEEFKAFDYAQGNKKTIASGEVDLGTLNGQYNENGYFYADYTFDTTIGSGSVNLNDKSLICSRYPYIGFAFTSDLGDKQIMKTANAYKRIIIKDSSYNNATAFKQSMSGVMAIYKTTTSYEEDIDIPAGYSVYKGGYQIQDGEVPYILTKEYSVSTKAQILANIEIDRMQQEEINHTNTRIDNIGEDRDTIGNQIIESSQKIEGNTDNISNHENRISTLEHSVVYLDTNYSIFNLIKNKNTTTAQDTRESLEEVFGKDFLDAIEYNVRSIYYLEDSTTNNYAHIHINRRYTETIGGTTGTYIYCTTESPYLLNGRSVALKISIGKDIDQGNFNFLLDKSFSNSKPILQHEFDDAVSVITTPPASANTTGQLKVVVLDSSQYSNVSVTKYDGYLYIFY